MVSLGAETYVVKGLVVNAVGFISVLHQLMDGEGIGIVGLQPQCRTLWVRAPPLKVFMIRSGYSSGSC